MVAYCKNNPINRKDDHGFRSSGVIDECGGMSEPPPDYVDMNKGVYDIYDTSRKAHRGNFQLNKNRNSPFYNSVQIVGTNQTQLTGKLTASKFANLVKKDAIKSNYFAVGYSALKNTFEYKGINKDMILSTALDAAGAITSTFLGNLLAYGGAAIAASMLGVTLPVAGVAMAGTVGGIAIGAVINEYAIEPLKKRYVK